MRTEERSVWTGIRNGLLGRCPACGEGRLFSRYLKVSATCAACGHKLAQYRSDDGPAYVTILIVGHLVVAPALLTEPVLTWPIERLFAVAIPTLVALTLALLPRVKGAFIGAQWAIGDHA